MFTLINCIIYWAALFAVAAFVLAIINLVKTHNVKEFMYDLDDEYVENYLDIKNIEDYLEELEKGINHNVDMSNVTLRNFKRAIETDRKDLHNLIETVAIHQDVLERTKDAMDMLDANINDTLDLVEDVLALDEFEYFEEEEQPKEEKKTKKQK